jgi:hypothetical protein
VPYILNGNVWHQRKRAVSEAQSVFAAPAYSTSKTAHPKIIPAGIFSWKKRNERNSFPLEKKDVKI